LVIDFLCVPQKIKGQDVSLKTLYNLYQSMSYDACVCVKLTANEKGLAFVGELEFRLPITEAQ
jgi:hypothetical protein